MIDKLYFSKGNKKLIPNNKVEFAIFSLPAEKTCPQATPLCKKSCYAKKAERLYPQVLKCRENNFRLAQSDIFIDLVIEYLHSRLASKSHTGKKLIVRIHESGDFFSQDYFNQWQYIASYFSFDKSIIFMAYTKSINFIDEMPLNMIIKYSRWADTCPADSLKAKDIGLPVYTAISKQDFDHISPIEQCHCVDCASCLKCYSNKIKNIYCAIH